MRIGLRSVGKGVIPRNAPLAFSVPQLVGLALAPTRCLLFLFFSECPVCLYVPDDTGILSRFDQRAG